MLSETIEKLGYTLVDVEYKNEDGQNILDLIIYNENGITLDDCEKTSRACEKILDENDPIEAGYCLCVSSMGLDRIFKTELDYKLSLSKDVKISLYRAVSGKSKHFGVLKEYDENNVTIINDENIELTFNRSDIAQIRLNARFE